MLGLYLSVALLKYFVLSVYFHYTFIILSVDFKISGHYKVLYLYFPALNVYLFCTFLELDFFSIKSVYLFSTFLDLDFFQQNQYILI